MDKVYILVIVFYGMDKVDSRTMLLHGPPCLGPREVYQSYEASTEVSYPRHIFILIHTMVCIFDVSAHYFDRGMNINIYIYIYIIYITYTIEKKFITIFT